MTKDNSTGKDKEFYSRGKQMFDSISTDWYQQDKDSNEHFAQRISLAEAYRCGVLAGAEAEREACAKVCDEMEEKAEEHGTECCKWPTPNDCAYAIRRLQAALAQPEQEPSQWREMVVVSLVREGINKHKARELADHFAAQRPWQGLTDEDKKKIATAAGCTEDDDGHIVMEIFRLAEIKLKGKNYDTARTQVG